MLNKQDFTPDKRWMERMKCMFTGTTSFLRVGLSLVLLLPAVTSVRGSDSNDISYRYLNSIRTPSHLVTVNGDTVISIREMPEGTSLKACTVREVIERLSAGSIISREPMDFTTKGSGPQIEGEEHFFINETFSRLPVAVDYSTDVEFGDVDGDGDLDCLVANTDGQPNRLMINDGSGVFSDESAFRLPSDSDFSLAAAFGDADGDGDLDLFVANNFAFQLPDCDLISGRNRLYLNNGHGLFFDVTEARLPESIAASTDAEWVDIDADGDLDLVVTNSIRPGECLFLGGGQLQILENGGNGFFEDVTAERVPGGFHSDVSVESGDMDGDGDMDLVVADPFERIRLLINTGLGYYADQSEDHL